MRHLVKSGEHIKVVSIVHSEARSGDFHFHLTHFSKAGIKPIIGLEAYVTTGTSRFDRQKVTWGEPWQRSDDVSASGSSPLTWKIGTCSPLAKSVG